MLTLDADVFIQKVGKYARQIVEELSAVRFEHPGPPRHRCPKCGMETLTLHRKVARCGDPDCAFLLFRTFNARELTDGEMLCLLEGKKTDFLPFVSRKGCNLQIFLCLFLEKLNMPQNTPVTKAS